MKEVKVLFIGGRLRQRRKETILNPPKGIRFISQRPLEEMPSEVTGGKKVKKRSLLMRMINLLRVPSIKYVQKKFLKGIDVIYSPGHLVLNRHPHVIEVDNAGCLGFYNYRTINNPLTRRVIRSFLLSRYCKGIVCISEAAKRSMISTYGEMIANKCKVVYPYVKINERVKKSADKTIFLCCNRKFYQKGTLAVLRAYRFMPEDFQKRSELWIISNTPPKIKDEFSSKNIRFFPAEYDKLTLYRRFYSKADVFVQPTLQDSFGLVYFETMANSMAIISTDVFAIPEFVEDGRNGVLIRAPFYMFNRDCTLKKEYFPRKGDLYKAYNADDMLTGELRKAMMGMIGDRHRLRKMQSASVEMLKSRFSEDRRKKNLRDLLISSAQ